ERTDAGGELRRARVVRRGQHADKAAAEVAEEITAVVRARKAEDVRPVERGANDGAVRAGVLIGVDGIAHAADSGRFQPFGLRPSVVSAAGAKIHFLPGILTHVVDLDAAESRVDSEGEWIAQAAGPDGAVQARGLREKRVVGGY